MRWWRLSERDTGGYFAYKVRPEPRETWSSTDSGGEMEVTGVAEVTKLKGLAYKRCFDLVILILAHIVLLPVWLLLWTLIPLLILISGRGPVFHRQERVGRNGRPFTVLKFRTMVPDADRIGPAWTTEGDSRVTKIGKVLRRTALDELPETLCILKGDMSLVGPRALDVAEQRRLEEAIPGFRQRLQIRPGMTGLAQVFDRRDDAEVKLKYDLEYIRSMNPWLDLKLLMLSVLNTVGAQWDRRVGKTGTTNPTEPS